ARVRRRGDRARGDRVVLPGVRGGCAPRRTGAGAARDGARDLVSVNLLDLDGAALERFVAGLGEKPFRARQLKRWLHRAGESELERMSDLARPFREKLARAAEIVAPRII